ncbi:hypothetical protein R1flu_001192 [Riccia fluitans]|uniref:Uncharacterized protein n=1 Tax=Riccia fluitans TaxID=41844 RepID=A0ABD1Y5T2_9MARC
MILAYLRGLHGHGYNRAKAILHGLQNEIHFLQSRAPNNEGGRPIPIVWAPCFVHIFFGLRCNLFVGTPLEEVEGWVGWTHVTKDTDMTLPQLHSKFPKLITSLSDLRQRCQLPEEIPIASPEQPVSTRRPCAEDKQPEEIVPVSPKQPMSSQRPKDIPIASPEQPVSSKRPSADDKERGLSSKKKNKLPSTERQSAKELSVAIRRDISQRSVTELEDFKRSVTANKKAAKETHLQKLVLVQTELKETKRSSEVSIKRLEEEASRLQEALAAKESTVQALENAHHKEISTLKATCRKYKTTLDGEIGTNADLQARVLNLQDELSTCKYTQEQAL